jgi:hypothetical protein
MSRVQHKLFLTTCDIGEPHPVSATDCSKCPYGSVVDNKTRVLCGGQTKFFLAPCFWDMRAAATVYDCEKCRFGEVGEDRLRVYCSRL